MLQMSKLLRSREEWKNKAVRRAEENREFRKSKKRHQERIGELKAQLASLEQVIQDKKNNTNQQNDTCYIREHMENT